MIPVQFDCPPPSILRLLREEIGLSQNELASELGFKEGGGDIVRAWEHGERYGKSFSPTPLAWRCFRLIVVCCRAQTVPVEDVKQYLRTNLSEMM